MRPNKAVDRELFLDLLARLTTTLKLESYLYVGLGGPFLEDFRVIHGRIGITKMVCVESELSVHLRQQFNRPTQGITCVHSTLEEFLDSNYFDDPVILWFDYTDPNKLTEQIERFARAATEVPLDSVLRITLNGNPSSLGKPDPSEVAVRVGPRTEGGDYRPTEQEWRLNKFRERMGNMFPSDLEPEGMTFKEFGKSVLSALRIAVERELLKFKDRKVVWALATHYADGQPMVTAALVVVAANDQRFVPLIQNWPFASTPSEPLRLDLPSLSTIERFTMETVPDPQSRMQYDLPKSDMGEDPFACFKKFYRMYPSFGRVEI